MSLTPFDPAVNPYGGGSAIAILFTALGNGALFKLILVITTAGQIFCVNASLTSCSRMMYAFSRDGAVPGGNIWKKVNKHRVPLNAVLVSSLIGVIITLPALWKLQAVHQPHSTQLFRLQLLASISPS